MTALRYSWTDEAANRMARRAARATQMGILSFAERADIGYYAIVVCLYEAHNARKPEPETMHVYMTAVWAIHAAAQEELRQHGYSTETKGPMRGYHTFWNGPAATQDEMEDRIIEPIAVHQVVAALPDKLRHTVEAMADWGDYTTAAEATGWSRNTIKCYLMQARREAQRLWWYPDPPPKRKWSFDRQRSEHATRHFLVDRARTLRIRNAKDAA